MTASPLLPSFNPSLHWHVGIEQEFFLQCSCGGTLVPRAEYFLQETWRRALDFCGPYNGWCGTDMVVGTQDDPIINKIRRAWTYEFSACQVEVRTDPWNHPGGIINDLRLHDQVMRSIGAHVGCRVMRLEVAPADMPMDHYPCERYDRLAAVIPPEVLLAAFRVAGTHFHIGMSCMEEAIEVHDALCAHLPELIAMGDHSHGERIRLYHKVVSWAMPNALVPPVGTSPAYGSVQGWLDYLHDADVGELRSCWDLVRITRHGTVELRALGIGANIDEILSWVERVYDLLGRTLR